MPKRISVTTPQFRTSLVRKLKNLFPDYSVEFLPADRGLKFRLTNAQNGYCSEVAQIYRYSDGVLSRSSLLGRVRFTSVNKGVQPPRRRRRT
jgi:hypothetical protein